MEAKRPSWRRFQKLKLSKKVLARRAKKLEKGTVRHAHRFVTNRLNRLVQVRRQIFGWLALVIILMLVSVAQWTLFRDAFMQSAPADGGTYSEGVLGPLETLNPLYARSSAEKSAARLLFASLYHYDTTGNLKGDIASGVKVSDDEKTYTVSLRQDVKWSDGTPLTAHDVAFTANLLRNPAARSEIAGWQSVRKAMALNDWTVQFELPAAYAPFMHALTFPVVSQKALSGVNPAELREHAYSTTPVTSGPFTLKLVQNSANALGTKKIVHMVANRSYHRGAPKLERFHLYAYASPDDIARGLTINEIIATPELLHSEQQERYTHQSHSLNHGVYALFNNGANSPLQSRQLRQALSRSVNQGVLRQKLPIQSGQLDGPILASQLQRKLPSLPVDDIAKAKVLLDEAGWKLVSGERQKDGAPLKLRMVTLKNPLHEAMAKQLALIWKTELGVATEVRVIDPADTTQDVLQTVLRPRQFDVLVYDLALGGDPDSYAYWHSSQANERGLNFANYNSAVADDALSGGRAKRSARQRDEKYQAFVRHWQADAPALPLYQPYMKYTRLPSVQAMPQSQHPVSPADRYASVLYWSVRESSVYKTP